MKNSTVESAENVSSSDDDAKPVKEEIKETPTAVVKVKQVSADSKTKMKAPQLDWMLLVNEALEGSGQNSDTESDEDADFITSSQVKDLKNDVHKGEDARLNFLNPSDLDNKCKVQSSGLPRNADDQSPMMLQSSIIHH